MNRDVAKERAELDRAVAGKTLCTVFRDTVERYPDLEALKWRGVEGWQSLTWSQYHGRVREVTLALLELGFRPGDFGLIMARNRPEHLVADLGYLHAGGTAVSVYNTLAPEQIEYIANHSEATFAVVEDEGFLHKFLQIRDRLPKLKKVVLLEGSVENDWVLGWNDLLELGRREGDANSFDRSWQRVKPEDLASLVYTSGTTGPPKAVMYSHYNALWTSESSIGRDYFQPGERLVSYLPYAHIAERLVSHWLNIITRSVVHFCPDPAQLLPALVEVRPTLFVGVPRVWEKLYTGINAAIAAEPDEQRRTAVQNVIAAGRQAAQFAKRGDQLPDEVAARMNSMAPVQAAIRAKVGLDQCHVAITSTAPISEELHEFFYALGLPLIEVWGQSELTGPATGNQLDRPRLGTVGTTYPGVEARLAEDGEILCRGGNVMLGYYKEPEKTAETIDSEGWVHTGDVGTVDADGYFRIIDRKKELIITSYGKNISPANLESLLKQHPLVGQACVIGDRRPYVTALIVLDHEVAPAWAQRRGIDRTTVAELAQHPQVREEIEKAVETTNQHVSHVEAIKRFTILPAEWTAESEELTPTLKLKRRVINEKYAAEIERMYETRVEEPARA